MFIVPISEYPVIGKLVWAFAPESLFRLPSEYLFPEPVPFTYVVVIGTRSPPSPSEFW